LVELEIKDNRPTSKYTPYNHTHGLLNLCSLHPDWECAYDLLRFSCKNNFDLPRYTQYIWLYLYSLKTRETEVWHRYDLDQNIDSYDNTYQTFYSTIRNNKVELSKFIKYIFTESENYELKVQCATYSENRIKNSCLYTSSKNVTILKGISFIYKCDLIEKFHLICIIFRLRKLPRYTTTYNRRI
jgi:hypothetical protein